MRPGRELMRGIYPLLNQGTVPLDSFGEHARALVDAGVTVLQIRIKTLPDAERLAVQRRVIEALAGRRVLVVIDDRADLARVALREARGVVIGLHLGQADLPPRLARALVGEEVLIGLSTHDLGQAQAASSEPIDYIGFGPVFPTQTKADPDPVVGTRALAAVCATAPHPVVAIGGIATPTLEVIREAGAAAAATVAMLWPAGLQTRAAEAAVLAARAQEVFA